MILIRLVFSFLIVESLLACIFLGYDNQISYAGSVNETNYKQLEDKIRTLEHNLRARIGVSLYDFEVEKEPWSYKGNTRFPLMSTFKTLVCAKALQDIEKQKISFNSTSLIEESSLVTWSPVTENYVGQKFSLKQACSATMVMSDNTAANIVLEKIGGPKALTLFMQTIGDNFTRLDRTEPDLGEALDGDARDTTTPSAMAKSLHVLLFGDVLSETSRAQLKQWMMDNKVSGRLFRSVLPNSWAIADRSGSGGYGSRGITAIVWPETHSPLIICVYLTQTKASLKERNQAIAKIGRYIFSLYE